MDTNIQSKFIMNVLSIDDGNGNLTVYVILNRNDKDVCSACGKKGKVYSYTNKKLRHSIFANKNEKITLSTLR